MQTAAANGLLLVDTKYEFGVDAAGQARCGRRAPSAALEEPQPAGGAPGAELQNSYAMSLCFLTQAPRLLLQIRLLDEVHTPDSSRYWVAATYAARHEARQEPENIDKEFLRLWFAERCDPYSAAPLPAAPPELVAELSRRYILLYQTITGRAFAPPLQARARPGRGFQVHPKP